MKIKLLLFAILFSVFGRGQSIITWDFTSGNTPSINLPAGGAALSYNTGGTLGTSGCTTNGYSSNNWNVNEYLQIVAPITGFNITTVTFNVQSSSTGPMNFKIQYSSTGVGGTFTDLGTTFVSPNGAPCSAISADFTSIDALDNNSNTVIRLVFTGGEADGSPATGDPAGTGTFRIDDLIINGNCISPPADPAGSITVSANPSCGPATLSYSSPSASLYWQTSPTGTSTASPTTSNYILNATGTIYVRVNSGGCWSTNNVNTGTVTINTIPIAPTTTNPAAVCEGTSVAITGSGSTGATSYTFWNAASGGTQYVTGGIYTYSSPTLTISSSALANTYTVYVQGENGSCLSPTRKAVTATINAVPTTPSGTISSSANPSCGPATLSYSSPSASLYWQTTSGGTSTAVANQTISNYTLNATGTIYVRANLGSCWSPAINSGLVTVNTLLAVTTQPTNKSITDGNNTTFAVVAAAGVSYQWQVDTGSGFVNLTNGGVYSNVTAATMNITAAPITMNGYLYRCIVTGTLPCTTVTSSSASLTVTYTAPNNPTNLSACYSNTSVDLSWTVSTPTAVGSYLPDGYMVFVLSGATAPASASAGNASTYTGNAVYTSAAIVTASLGKCVYKGTGTSVSISALTNATNYSYTVVAYRGNTATVWSSGINANGSWRITNVTTDMSEVTSLAASVSNSQSTISWTNVPSVLTCNYEYLIVANQGAVVFTPSGDGTAYSANSVYSGVNQVIYKGSGTNMTVTGLTNGLNYCFKVFVRRGTDWSNGVSICITPYLNYCASSGTTTFSTSVTNVTLNTINNASGKPSGYSDYTAISTNLTAGLSYTLSVNVDTAGDYEVDGYAWIDFNQNGLFTDAGEFFNLGSVQNVVNGATLSSPLTIAIPANATLGTTRMRITASYDTGINSCSNSFDGEVEDYTINILAGCTSAIITSVTPNMAPVGTEVTINSTSGLAGATATFSGFAAIPVSSSATQLVVKVPPSAVTGDIVVTNAALCAGIPYPYSIIKEDKTSCEGVGGTFNDLIISEVFDTNAGNGFYLELYNPTNAAITVNASNPTYRIEIDNDKNGVLNGVNRTINITGTIPAGGVIVYNFGNNTPGESPCTSVATINLFGNGTNANDGIYLTKNNVVIDKLITTNETGYSMLRNLTAVGPTTTYNAADWTISGTESCADLGTFPANPKLAPIVTLNPTYSPSCKSTSLTIAGTEGYNGVGDTKELAYQWYVSAPAPALTDWTPLTDGGIYSGTSTLNLAISNISGVINYQYYCQIRENSSTCFSATNAIKITDGGAVTWNGTDWRDSSNVLSSPSLAKLAIINGNYDTAINGSFDACSLVVNNGFTAIIAPTNYINIQYDLTLNGNLTVKSGGSLVQIDDFGLNSGTGNFVMERTATVARTTDYVYWSSPISNFQVGNVNPSSWLRYKWIPTIPRAYTSNFGGWLATPANEVMEKGKGYIIRGPYTNPTATFTNTAPNNLPNNGIIPVGVERSTYDGAPYTYLSGSTTLTVVKDDDNYNLLGNPYPSAVDVQKFLSLNTNLAGHIRLWTHGTPIQSSLFNGQSFYNSFGYTYSVLDYIYVNYTGISSGPGDYAIASGQGFFVTMNHSSASASENVIFNNSMRRDATLGTIYNNSVFYRKANTNERNRIWLDILDDKNASVRTLVGYIQGATLDKDRMYDAKATVDSNLNIYSLIQDESQIIQARAVPFDKDDRVPLGVSIPLKVGNTTSTLGTYKIAIAFVDGLFQNKNQDIYLEDKLLNVIHDLRKDPYTFESVSGRFDNRFVLRYTNKNKSLGTDHFKEYRNSVVVAADAGQVKIMSSIEAIKKVAVYDILGREIFTKNNINAMELSIKDIIINRQALVVKVVLENGQEISKKIIL